MSQPGPAVLGAMPSEPATGAKNITANTLSKSADTKSDLGRSAPKSTGLAAAADTCLQGQNANGSAALSGYSKAMLPEDNCKLSTEPQTANANIAAKRSKARASIRKTLAASITSNLGQTGESTQQKTSSPVAVAVMNSKGNWTPGPWKTHSNIGRKGQLGVVADAAPCIIAIMGNQQAWPVESQANARLIASAPDLLQALKASVKSAEHYGADPYQEPWLIDARAAIAKAEGRDA